MENIVIPTTTRAPRSCASTLSWRRQRILFLLAGAFTLVSTGLAFVASPWFGLVAALVGANQLFMAAMGWCPMSRLLDRFASRTV
ncbi:MAG TPA: DUF2892 domain-containing protein [Acidimicrobiales bacterium]|nr:DUF2892 domain-containing protein [Acidimicrobiales bacterium]